MDTSSEPLIKYHSMRKLRLKFSLGWCIGVILLHIGGTWLLFMAMFVSGMGSFTSGPGPVYYLAKAIMWIWSPLAMLVAEGHLQIGRSPEVSAILWSVMVGLLAGLIGGSLRKPAMQDTSADNPDLVGTPWAHDPGFKTRKTNRASRSKFAEQSGESDSDNPLN
jgi:hypothetical protein